MQIKTITTATGVNEIDFGNDDSQTTAHFYWFKNLSDSILYVSVNPDPVAGEDNVAELPAKGAASVETDEGKVYVLGAGKVEIHRTDSKFCPFELAVSGSGGGGSGSITVDSELSETSINPLQNKATTKAINEVKTELSSKSNTGHTHLTSEITDFPDALPANGGNADYAVKAGTVNSLRTDNEYSDIFSTTLSDSHPCWNKKCSVQGQSTNPNEANYIENAPETMAALWYEVETIGVSSRAYQIAHGCFTQQHKSFIRYMHDGAWSGWKNIADGGNAYTVDNLHANDFMKVNRASGYDCNTLYDAGLYLCTGGATNTPNDLTYGVLLVMPYRKPYGNASPDYGVQMFIPNGDVSDKSMWYRTSLETTWNEWARSCDGGNADTIDGLHANDFYTSGNKPYVTGESSNFDDHGRLVTNHGFIPSAAFIWVKSAESSGEKEKKGFILDATYGEFNTENAIVTGHPISAGSATYGYIIFK